MGNAAVPRTKTNALRDILQVESIWKSCFYVLVGTILVS